MSWISERRDEQCALAHHSVYRLGWITRLDTDLPTRLWLGRLGDLDDHDSRRVGSKHVGRHIPSLTCIVRRRVQVVDGTLHSGLSEPERLLLRTTRGRLADAAAASPWSKPRRA